MKPTKALIAHASDALSDALRFSGPADQAVSRVKAFLKPIREALDA